MKTILFSLSILLCVIALPTFAELTEADLNKIRLIVKDEVKSEISASEKRMKEYISQEIKTVNAKIEGNDDRLRQIFWVVIALMGLIALPQAFLAWRSKKDSALERQIQTLTQEIETLKQQRIVNP